MALKLKVCRLEDVPPGEVRGFDVEGIEEPILVAHIDGEVYAATSICPHESQVSLIGGTRRDTRITCPAHSYEFDLKTGACSHDSRLALRRYRVTVAGGEVWVDLV